MPDRPAHLLEFGNGNDPLFLWEKAAEVLSDALNYLEPVRRVTRPRFNPWADDVEIINDFPAPYHRAFKKLRSGMLAVHQYGGRGNPWFRDSGKAARGVLRIDARITESELHALMALAACWWGMDSLRELPKDPAQWPRRLLDYVGGLLQDAERWLAEAYRLAQATTQQAAIRDAWAADSHREKSAKGGKAPKGSEGVRLLALALREEKPSASAEALFRAAHSRAPHGMAGGYTITANTEDQLVSIGPDGEPDGLPVGLAGWRKILIRKR